MNELSRAIDRPTAFARRHGYVVRHAVRLFALGAVLGLTACNTLIPAPLAFLADDGPAPAEAPAPAELKYFPSSDPMKSGLDNFYRGNHGLAERYFRDAIEKSPKNAQAWVALAACYDHIRRFDLADRAYRRAVELAGETIQLLNNRGYSYMMRGDFKMARVMFTKAYRRDPGNLTVLNNLKILDSKLTQPNPT